MNDKKQNINVITVNVLIYLFINIFMWQSQKTNTTLQISLLYFCRKKKNMN